MLVKCIREVLMEALTRKRNVHRDRRVGVRLVARIANKRLV